MAAVRNHTHQKRDGRNATNAIWGTLILASVISCRTLGYPINPEPRPQTYETKPPSIKLSGVDIDLRAKIKELPGNINVLQVIFGSPRYQKEINAYYTNELHRAGLLAPGSGQAGILRCTCQTVRGEYINYILGGPRGCTLRLNALSRILSGQR